MLKRVIECCFCLSGEEPGARLKRERLCRKAHNDVIKPASVQVAAGDKEGIEVDHGILFAELQLRCNDCRCEPSDCQLKATCF